jgi:hypothetical protein
LLPLLGEATAVRVPLLRCRWIVTADGLRTTIAMRYELRSWSTLTN